MIWAVDAPLDFAERQSVAGSYRSRPRREVAHEPMPARTATTAKPMTHQTVRDVDSDDGVPPGVGVVGLAWVVLAAGLMTLDWWQRCPVASQPRSMAGWFRACG